MNRLWVRLTLALTAIILITVGAIAVLIQRTTDTEFRQYITHSGMRASGSGIEQLVNYYQQEGSWKGVEDLLADGIYVSGLMGNPVFPFRDPRPGMPGGQLDVMLADVKGKVIFDSAGRAEGQRLSSRDQSRALPIAQDDQEVIGYLLLSVSGSSDRLGTLEQQFLDRIEQVLFAGAALAVALGLIAAAFLSSSLTAPLRRLAAAARAVAGGDLGKQVKIEGSAEIAEVGQAFNEMTAALELSEQQRQNMVADIAHELRTPLSVVQGNLQAILDDVYSLDKAEISRLYDETRLLGRLVDDLRELALADAGQLRLNLQPTDVARVIQTMSENLALAVEAQEVEFSAKIPEELPTVLADADRLAQVLRNLLVNALRHTPPGGSVTVTAAAAGDAVEISVTDTGEGIAKEDLPHVFDRFWRAERSRTRDSRISHPSDTSPESASDDSTPTHHRRGSGGAGLGLSVAQSLIEAQGGRIWAESTLGQGSTFHFTLPCNLHNPTIPDLPFRHRVV